jgi:hypothetical protein
MKFTTPWNIGVTGETTVELSMASDAEAREVAKHLERKGIVCEISGHWLQAESHWAAVVDVLRGLVPPPPDSPPPESPPPESPADAPPA